MLYNGHVQDGVIVVDDEVNLPEDSRIEFRVVKFQKKPRTNSEQFVTGVATESVGRND